jgi:hypothetical protein
MNVRGSLRASAALGRSRARARLTEPGPSRLHAAFWSARRAYSSGRPFHSVSVVDYPRQSVELKGPRWLNVPRTRDPQDGSSRDQTPDGSAADGAARRVRLDDADGASGQQGAAGSGAAPPASSSGENDGSDGHDASKPPAPPPDSPPPPPNPSQTSISKQSVPDVYPQVLALPIARRPLFPGFYKAVVIRNPAVVAAIKDMMKRGQPYIGAFLLKDEQADADIVTDMDAVHPVGVFAQITSVFAANAGAAAEGAEEGLTAVLYPHRRIKITELLKAGRTSVKPADEENAQLETPPATPEAEEARQVIQGKFDTVMLHTHRLTIHSRPRPELFPPLARRLDRPGRQPRHAAIQQGRPAHPRVHVRDRLRVQGHRAAQPSLPGPDHQLLHQPGRRERVRRAGQARRLCRSRLGRLCGRAARGARGARSPGPAPQGAARAQEGAHQRPAAEQTQPGRGQQDREAAERVLSYGTAQGNQEGAGHGERRQGQAH